jgi:hypothetical protein
MRRALRAASSDTARSPRRARADAAPARPGVRARFFFVDPRATRRDAIAPSRRRASRSRASSRSSIRFAFAIRTPRDRSRPRPRRATHDDDDDGPTRDDDGDASETNAVADGARRRGRRADGE